MFCTLKKKKICPPCASKHCSNCEKQVLLMIPNRKGLHHLAVKKLSVSLREIMSKHGDFYCPNCLHSFATENKCESHKKLCENKDFCNFIMPYEDTKIFRFNQYQKSDKGPFIIYGDLGQFG